MAEGLVELLDTEREFCANGEISVRIERQSGELLLIVRKDGPAQIPRDAVKSFYLDVRADPAKLYLTWQIPGQNLSQQMVGPVRDVLKASTWISRVNNIYKR